MTEVAVRLDAFKSELFEGLTSTITGAVAGIEDRMQARLDVHDTRLDDLEARVCTLEAFMRIRAETHDTNALAEQWKDAKLAASLESRLSRVEGLLATDGLADAISTLHRRIDSISRNLDGLRATCDLLK